MGKKTIETLGKDAGGKGTTINGSAFEKDVARFIMDKFKGNNFTINNHDEEEGYKKIKLSKTQFLKVIRSESGELLFMYGSQNALFKYLEKKQFNTEWTDVNVPTKIKEVWEKDIRPDLFILDFRTNAKKFITFIEVKYQNSSGSVDEKIQTSAFKKDMWNKLFKSFVGENRIEYIYALSNWFKQSSKKGTKNYYYQDLFEFLNKIPKTMFFLNETKDWDKKKNEKGELKLVYLENEVNLVTQDGDDFDLKRLIGI